MMTCEEFIEDCKKHLRKPYIYGANGPDSFDCSGFVQFVLKDVGLDPSGDQSAEGLYEYFHDPNNGVVVDTPECGCLVFYGEQDNIQHVALCIDKENMIEAGGGDHNTTSVEIARKKKAEVRIKPINRRSDIVDFIRPIGLPWS